MGPRDLEETLRGMLSGEIDLLDGCRLLIRYREELQRVAPDEYAIIAGVESETDDLPLGHGEADIIDCSHAAIGLDQAGDFDGGGSVGHFG